MNDLKAKILQDDKIIKALPGNVDPEVINKVLIPKIIQMTYPELTVEEVEEIRQHVVVDSAIKNGKIQESETGDKRFIVMANQFVNIDELHIDLIDRINPFQNAFEILSKSVTARVFKIIQESIEATRIQMSDEEAVYYYKKAVEFKKLTGKNPDINSLDPSEKKMAESIIYVKKAKREKR